MAKWKGSAPLLGLLFAVAAASWSGVLVTEFWKYITLSTAWFLVVPVLNELGMEKKSKKWFVGAGVFGLFSASFSMLRNLKSILTVFSQSWVGMLVDVGLVLSWIMAAIGSLTLISNSFSE